MTMRPLLAILLLLFAIPLCHAGGTKAPPKTPAARTRELLDTRGHEIVLQDIKQIDKMRTLLSKELYAALRAARLEQDAFLKDHPDDKTPPVGIGFHSGKDNGFDSYDVRLTNALAKNRAAVDVEFVMDSAQPKPIRWRDRFEWVLEGSTWKLDDIVYLSTGRPSRNERRLKPFLLKPPQRPN